MFTLQPKIRKHFPGKITSLVPNILFITTSRLQVKYILTALQASSMVSALQYKLQSSGFRIQGTNGVHHLSFWIIDFESTMKEEKKTRNHERPNMPRIQRLTIWKEEARHGEFSRVIIYIWRFKGYTYRALPEQNHQLHNLVKECDHLAAKWDCNSIAHPLNYQIIEKEKRKWGKTSP